MNDMFPAALEILKAGEGVVLARIVHSRGSTPRTAGAGMIIRRDRRMAGTIGGGPVEAAVIRMAREIFTTRHSVLSVMELSAETAAETDMICGGRLAVLCEHIAPEEETVTFLESVLKAGRDHRMTIVCTGFEGEDNRLRCLGRFWTRDGRDNPPFPVPDEIRESLRRMSRQAAGSTLLISEGRKYCIDVLEGRPPVYIFGAGHVAGEVSALAVHVGFRTVVLDDREEYADPCRFQPPAEVRLLDSFEECFANLDVDADSYVVIATRGHVHDMTVLAQALKTKAGYIGMIGSRKKRDRIYAALLAEGFTETDLGRVRSPIGLPIDTETPEEIAVSIVGELIDQRSRKRKWIGGE
ncbi:MAG: XdhC family aldehyde oxidoreductase maturation factor [Thermodesulfobacteriota bacterium]